jgi:hypothetical protein
MLEMNRIFMRHSISAGVRLLPMGPDDVGAGVLKEK